MSPLVMFRADNLGAELQADDRCSLCDRVTARLIWVRVWDMLVGMCGVCIDSLHAGYQAAAARWDEQAKREAF